MKQPFKVGDRVVVYDRGRIIGFVCAINNPTEMNVDVNREVLYSIHPKQVRRLIKNKRRAIWVNPEWLLEERTGISFNDIPGYAKFIEAKRD